jgi:enoyl-CoA hydratase/carnithine racemase
MTQTSSDLQTLSIEHDDGVAIVTLDNPPMNIINETVGTELDQVVRQLGEDDSVRAIIFRSATEGLFVAGADIGMLGQLGDTEVLERFQQFASLFDRLAALPQPTIAALAGTTLGGGFEWALACDFRFMADGFGEIGLPEVRQGLLPGGGGTQRLPRLVGAGVATEMLLKGMRYNAQTALELGLVHRVYAAEQLDDEARKYARSLAAQAPLAVQAIKRLVRASFETPGQEGLELERKLFLELARSEDAKEGIGAFFEGRKPTFTGS